MGLTLRIIPSMEQSTQIEKAVTDSGKAPSVNGDYSIHFDGAGWSIYAGNSVFELARDEAEAQARCDDLNKTQLESEIAGCDAEYACGLMTWARHPEEDWSAYDRASEKAFDGWHKAGPESAQY